MRFFDIFTKDKRQLQTTDNGVEGPTFLDGLTEHIVEPKNRQKHEWRRRLKATSGHTKFRIRYFGQLHPDYKNLIVGTNDIPALVLAIEPISGQETNEQKKNRSNPDLIFDFIKFLGKTHGRLLYYCDSGAMTLITKLLLIILMIRIERLASMA